MTSPNPIPFFDLTRQYREVGDKIRAAVEPVLATQQFVLGETVSRFEKKIADFLKAPHAVGVASGTDALVLLLKAAGLSVGEAVLVPSFTFYASASSICLAGGRPLWAEVDDRLFLVTPETLERSLMSQAVRGKDGVFRTLNGNAPVRGVMVVHLYGQMADMSAISRWADDRGLWVVEDACQSIGALHDGKGAGTFSRGAAYSFFPTKNLGGAGDGGLIATQDSQMADRIRSLRVHGSRQRYVHDELGYNSRLDAIQAAILEAKLAFLPGWNSRRRFLAKRYSDAFSGLSLFRVPAVQKTGEAVFHQYTIVFSRTVTRDRVKERLLQEGIGTEIYYPVPQHRQTAFQSFFRTGLDVTDRLSASVLSLPVFPELTETEQDRVIYVLSEVAGKGG
ncbi:MAG: DegT/DnrJ/EryC1/StrS family aminotransferase [Leptospirillum sp.]